MKHDNSHHHGVCSRASSMHRNGPFDWSARWQSPRGCNAIRNRWDLLGKNARIESLVTQRFAPTIQLISWCETRVKYYSRVWKLTSVMAHINNKYKLLINSYNLLEENIINGNPACKNSVYVTDRLGCAKVVRHRCTYHLHFVIARKISWHSFDEGIGAVIIQHLYGRLGHVNSHRWTNFLQRLEKVSCFWLIPASNVNVEVGEMYWGNEDIASHASRPVSFSSDIIQLQVCASVCMCWCSTTQSDYRWKLSRLRDNSRIFMYNFRWESLQKK